MCACFSCLACVRVDAKVRQVVIPALDDVGAIFAIVLKGVAIITESGEGLALKAGSGYMFMPTSSLRLEVEGSTSVLFAYAESKALGSDASQKDAKLVKRYAGAWDKAWDELRPLIKGKVWKGHARRRRQRLKVPTCRRRSRRRRKPRVGRPQPLWRRRFAAA